jgi:hypothetical protein
MRKQMKIYWLSMFFGCSGKTVDTGTIVDSAVPEEQTPVQPEPFTVSVTGATNLSLSFDTPTCQIPEAAPNFNTFWRSSTGAHVFVLRVSILGVYEGTGAYNSNVEDSRALMVSLQEEAGGEGRYYTVDTDQGQLANVELTAEEDLIYGQLLVSELYSTIDGVIQISPTSIPIWCDENNTAG